MEASAPRATSVFSSARPAASEPVELHDRDLFSLRWAGPIPTPIRMVPFLIATRIAGDTCDVREEDASIVLLRVLDQPKTSGSLRAII